MILQLVTRQGCHLCEEALVAVLEAGFTPELVDVDDDPELFRLYDWRVPVLLVDGRAACEGRITGELARRVLRRPETSGA